MIKPGLLLLRLFKLRKRRLTTTANLLPSEVAAHECIEHFTLPGTDRSNPPGILTALLFRLVTSPGHIGGRRGPVRLWRAKAIVFRRIRGTDVQG